MMSNPAVRPAGEDGDHDNADITANTNDPTQGGSTIRQEGYQTTAFFSNKKSAIANGEYGQWDFYLNTSLAEFDASYCIRAVKSDGTLLDTYNTFPMLSSCTAIDTTRRLRHGATFCGGRKQRYTWF
jgi:hypothetical protein